MMCHDQTTIYQVTIMSASGKISNSRAPLGETILRRLYSYMLKCRTVEERIRLLFRQGRFSGNYFAAVGQEATEVGATIDLLAENTHCTLSP